MTGTFSMKNLSPKTENLNSIRNFVLNGAGRRCLNSRRGRRQLADTLYLLLRGSIERTHIFEFVEEMNGLNFLIKEERQNFLDFFYMRFNRFLPSSTAYGSTVYGSTAYGSTVYGD